MDEKAKRADFNDIMSALNISPAMLADSHERKFTARHEQRLKTVSGDAGLMMVLGIGLLMLMAIAFCSGKPADKSSSVLVSLIALAMPLILIGTGASRQSKTQEDITVRREVSADTGELQVGIKNGRSPTLYLQVAGVTHDISRRAYDLLKTRQGESMTIYYAPVSKTFFALEPAQTSPVPELDTQE